MHRPATRRQPLLLWPALGALALLPGLLAGSACRLRAAEASAPGPLKASEVLPGDSVLAISLLDVAGLKQALVASDFGKLCAEPDFQHFIKPIWDALWEKYSELRKANPLLPDYADLDKTLSGEWALTVTLPAKPGLQPTFCTVLRVGDAKAAARILAPFLGGRPLTEGAVLPLGPAGGPALVFEKSLLLFATSEEALQKMRARVSAPAMRGDALASAKFFSASQKLLGGPGLLTVSADAQALLHFALAQEQDAEQAAKAKNLVAKAGVTGVQALAFQLGVRGTLLAFDLAIALDGPAKGLVRAYFDTPALAAAALKVVPEKASFCSASHFDVQGLLGLVRALLDAEKLQELEAGLAAAQETLGFDIEKDLLPHIGPAWVAYDVGGVELFGLLPGMALAIELKDPAKFQQALDALVAAAEKAIAAAGPFMPEAKFREVKLGETRVRYLNLAMLPLSPSLAVAKGRLFLTSTVNGMRRALAQLGAPGDITANKNFGTALARVTGKPLDLAALPGQFNYYCPDPNQASLSSAAQLAQMFLGMFKMQARLTAGMGMGANPEAEALWAVLDHLDFALFPADEIIARYLKPSASALVKQEGGVVLRSDLAVPTTGALGSGQGGVFSLALLAGIATPNLLRSSMAANESAAIAGCMTYAAAQDIYRRTDWDGDDLLEYAQSIRGNNSLYEKKEGTGDLTLVDAGFAGAEVAMTLKPLEEKDLPEPKAEDAPALAKHLPKLSSDEFGEREAASAAIEKMGPSVIKLLDKEVKANKDTEVRERCRVLVEGLKFGLAQKQGATIKKATAPKAGYYFKVLTGQGPDAPGGRKSYVVAGAGAQAHSMTLGYALLAYPAKWDGTGRNTFLINNTGTVYQKDLGAETQKIAEGITEYNPEQTWVVAE